MQTTSHEEKLEKCRVGANEHIPFACPEGCLFYEPRKVSGAGWTVRNPATRRPDRTGDLTGHLTGQRVPSMGIYAL